MQCAPEQPVSTLTAEKEGLEESLHDTLRRHEARL